MPCGEFAPAARCERGQRGGSKALLDDDSVTESPLWNVGRVVPFRVKHLPNTTKGLILGSSREPTASVSQPAYPFAPPDA